MFSYPQNFCAKMNIATVFCSVNRSLHCLWPTGPAARNIHRLKRITQSPLESLLGRDERDTSSRRNRFFAVSSPSSLNHYL
jgi:hypothetical protein